MYLQAPDGYPPLHPLPHYIYILILYQYIIFSKDQTNKCINYSFLLNLFDLNIAITVNIPQLILK